MRTSLKRAILRTLAHSGIERLLWPAFGGIGSILMLHRVAATDRILNRNITISVALLDRLIRQVRSLDYEIVTLDEVQRRVRGGLRGRRFICFTFDDGYADNYELALPVFRRHGIPMSVYITTGFLDRSANYWWGALERLLLQNERITITRQGTDTVYPLRNFAEKTAAFDALVAQSHVNRAGFLPLLDDLLMRHKLKPQDALDEDALTIEQARRLVAEPLVTIGAHGLTHRPLSWLGPDEARWEIQESRTRLERCLDTEINHFAYPYGSPLECGVREFALVKEAGYKTATTTRCGNINPAHRNHFSSLPRLPVGPEWESWPIARLHLSGSVSALKYGFARVVI